MSNTGFPWDMRPREYGKRNPFWFKLNQSVREYVVARHREGIDVDQIVDELKEKYRIPADRPLVKVIIAEEGLPEFREVEPYRCPGCRQMVLSNPCIVCTSNRIGK